MSTGTKTAWVKGIRREDRIPGCKPVTVLGKDKFGNPFSQNTFTVEISASGARLQGLPPLEKDAILLLESGNQQARYRVVWIGKSCSGHDEQVGLLCLEPEKAIFGLDPPVPGTFYDEYKRVEAELYRTRDRYKVLFDNSLGLICTHDLNGVLLSINPATAKALGYEPGTGIGMNLADFLAPSVRTTFPEYLLRVRNRGCDSGYMLVVARNRKKHVWLYRNLLICEDGALPYVLGHAMDVTEQKSAEYTLQSVIKQLQRALAEVTNLKGLLPLCAWCKRIRTAAGSWTDLESYITAHSNAQFSHGVCPDCIPKIRSS